MLGWFPFPFLGWNLDLGAKSSWVPIPTLPLTGWETLDKLLRVSEPPFSHL